MSARHLVWEAVWRSARDGGDAMQETLGLVRIVRRVPPADDRPRLGQGGGPFFERRIGVSWMDVARRAAAQGIVAADELRAMEDEVAADPELAAAYRQSM